MTRSFAAYGLALALAFSAPLCAQEAPGGAVDPPRISAARELMEVTGVSRQLDGMVDAMKQGFARGAKAETSAAGSAAAAEFDKSMARLLAYKQDMMTDFAALYAEKFSAEEMKAVADFYRGGAGAKFIALTPELMQSGAKIGMKYSEKIAAEMQSAKPPQ